MKYILHILTSSIYFKIKLVVYNNMLYIYFFFFFLLTLLNEFCFKEQFSSGFIIDIIFIQFLVKKFYQVKT